MVQLRKIVTRDVIRRLSRNVDTMLQSYLNNNKKNQRLKYEDVVHENKASTFQKKNSYGAFGKTNNQNKFGKTGGGSTKKLYGNEKTYVEITSHNNAQSKYLKDQMQMINKVKKSRFIS